MPARAAYSWAVGWTRNKLFDWGASYLTEPLGEYRRLSPHPPDLLRRTLRPGDILLVEGDQRVSEIIKFLTQSSWSHAAIYVGDLFEDAPESEREAKAAEYREDASHLLIEALLQEGVIASPLGKYAEYNLRICRPIGLQQEDLARIVAEVRTQIGSHYDVRHVLDLARYFFPVSLIPRRFRRTALEMGSDLTHEVICSTLIAHAFQNVGFPILPEVTLDGEAPPKRWYERFLRNRAPYRARFRKKRTSLVTPRDFDLSPYFEIVKPDVVGLDSFDYRRIQWDEPED